MWQKQFIGSGIWEQVFLDEVERRLGAYFVDVRPLIGEMLNNAHLTIRTPWSMFRYLPVRVWARAGW